MSGLVAHKLSGLKRGHQKSTTELRTATLEKLVGAMDISVEQLRD